MSPATTTTAPSSASAHNPYSASTNLVKTEVKIPPMHIKTTPSADMPGPSTSSFARPIRIEGSEEDMALSKSEYLTRAEVLRRRARRVKQLARIYRDHYWALMEELKQKYREYYWEYGTSPFQDDEEIDKIEANGGDCYPKTADSNGNSNNGNLGVSPDSYVTRCVVHGCKAKAMALTKFCHMHILSDSKQRLYTSCTFPIKSSPGGPILCGKPILRSVVPSYCSPHYMKAEKVIVRSLKKAGLNVSSTSRLAPKFHVIIAEYVRLIQSKRRASAHKSALEYSEIKEDNGC